MDPLVDVIEIVPKNFQAIVERTADAANPLAEEWLQETWKRNAAKNEIAYVMIQTIKVVQYYEKEYPSGEVSEVEPTATLDASEEDPSEPGTTPR